MRSNDSARTGGKSDVTGAIVDVTVDAEPARVAACRAGPALRLTARRPGRAHAVTALALALQPVALRRADCMHTQGMHCTLHAHTRHALHTACTHGMHCTLHAHTSQALHTACTHTMHAHTSCKHYTLHAHTLQALHTTRHTACMTHCMHPMCNAHCMHTVCMTRTLQTNHKALHIA